MKLSFVGMWGEGRGGMQGRRAGRRGGGSGTDPLSNVKSWDTGFFFVLVYKLLGGKNELSLSQ